MIATRSGRAMAAMLLAGVMLPGSGCIAWEIRDELTRINASMDDIKAQLDTANQGLSALERTNSTLAELDTKLETLKTTNASLASIDTHLASLRKTLKNIDSTIPFLKVSGDDSDEEIMTAEEKAAAEAGTQPPPADPAIAEPAPTDPASATPPPAEDPGAAPSPGGSGGGG
ncbi:MAG: hypothetical protein AAFX79_06535 [Planctomycetota bacterium]